MRKLAKIRGIGDIGGDMNATEIIEQYKRLPENEQDKVVEFIRHDLSNKVRYADGKAAEDAVKAVFSEHSELFRKLAQ